MIVKNKQSEEIVLLILCLRKGKQMKGHDIGVLQGIQRNTEMAMKAIELLETRVDDDDLAMQISRQGLRYSEFNQKATEKLLNEKAPCYRENGFRDLMLRNSIKGSTLLNTSTGHIAELMIQNSNKGLTDMWKTLNHYENAGNISMEIAKEFMDFEEKNIERLKKYL